MSTCTITLENKLDDRVEYVETSPDDPIPDPRPKSVVLPGKGDDMSKTTILTVTDNDNGPYSVAAAVIQAVSTITTVKFDKPEQGTTITAATVVAFTTTVGGTSYPTVTSKSGVTSGSPSSPVTAPSQFKIDV